MVFSSIPFLFFFLPIVLLFYFSAPNYLKNGILFFSSLFFYAWGETIYIALMLFSTILDFCHGLLIEKFRNQNQEDKVRYVLCSSIFMNLSVLGFFKYSNFLIDTLNQLSSLEITPLNLPLPIGISFYTFQTMSYTIDVYRKQASIQKNIISFGAYVALFPQLIAGPIVRYQDIADQLNNRFTSFDDFGYGVNRFVWGLGKKVLLANNIGFLWNTIIESDISQLSIGTAWLGILAYTFQIYFDFSGYSDMAIGLGRMFGFRITENFNYPYTSKSISEFWRRWHISLGTWFREYVYIPLGGNRVSFWRSVRNLFVVWFLTGVWHGANWNFILWGLYFGVLLFLEKYVYSLKHLPNLFQHLYTMFLVVIGWWLFAFEDFEMLFLYGSRLFGFGNVPIFDQTTLYFLSSYGFLFLILLFASTPIPKEWATQHKQSTLFSISSACYLLLILSFSTAFVINSSYNPFLYFRF